MGDFAPSCRAEGPGLMELRRSKQNLCSVYFLKGERKTAKGGASLLWDSSPPTPNAILEVDVTFPGEEEWKQNKTNPLLTIDRDTHPYHVWLLFWQHEFWGLNAQLLTRLNLLSWCYHINDKCSVDEWVRTAEDSSELPGAKGFSGLSLCVAETAGVTTAPCSNILNTNRIRCLPAGTITGT